MMLTIGRNNRNTVVEGTSGQNFIIVCLQCLRVKHYHTQECLSGAHGYMSVSQNSDVERACEQHSADSNKKLRLHSD